MTISEDEFVKKSVDVLIKTLQKNSHTRKIALQELVAPDKKAVPYIVSYLEREEQLEADLKNLNQCVGAAYWNYRKLFKKEWGHKSNTYKKQSSTAYKMRKNAVQGALEALKTQNK